MEEKDRNDEEQHSDDVGIRAHWVVVAETESRTMAEFAINGLKSYDIPAVLDARPGILGTAGMRMRSLKTGKMVTFKIMVPPDYAEEAAEAVKIFLGNGRDEKEDVTENDSGDEIV
jgi:hypothetical protein